MYDHHGRGGNVFGAFLFGGLVGAILGLLFAPRSGKETREILADRGQEYLDEAKDTYGDGRERLVEAYSTAKDVVSVKAVEYKDRVGEVAEVVKEKIDEGSTVVRAKVTELGKEARAGIKSGAEAAKGAVDVTGEKAKDALGFVAEKTGEPMAAPVEPGV
jgi:gas vesicle protein